MKKNSKGEKNYKDPDTTSFILNQKPCGVGKRKDILFLFKL